MTGISNTYADYEDQNVCMMRTSGMNSNNKYRINRQHEMTM